MPPIPPSQALVEILADMVSSATAWEEKHGGPPDYARPREVGLTELPTGIHRVAHETTMNGGREHDDDDTDGD